VLCNRILDWVIHGERELFLIALEPGKTKVEGLHLVRPHGRRPCMEGREERRGGEGRGGEGRRET
jgi:hypothetical protein